MKKIISLLLALCMAFSFSSIAFASNVQSENLNNISYLSSKEVRGPAAPTQIWDLSSEDYYGNFIFAENVFTNCKFTGHNGNIYLLVTGKIKESNGLDTSNYMLNVRLVKRTLGVNLYVSTVQIPIGETRIISFTDWSPGTEYFIAFSQPNNQKGCVISGDFIISNTKKWF